MLLVELYTIFYFYLVLITIMDEPLEAGWIKTFVSSLVN